MGAVKDMYMDEADNILSVTAQKLVGGDISEDDGAPNIEHDNLFALNWSRFGNVTLEKWSKSKEDWVLQ